MSITPPESWSDWSDQSAIPGSTHIVPVAPIVWDPASHLLGVREASAAQSGVITTGIQSIGGLKTFSIAPKCAIAPTDSADLSNKGYIDSLVRGISWQDEVLSFNDMSGSPPVAPAIGTRYISTTTGGGFTQWYIYEAAGGGTYIETAPTEGYAVYVSADLSPMFANMTCIFNGATWVNLGSSLEHGTLIGLSADDHTGYFKVVGRPGESLSLQNADATPKATSMATEIATGKLIFTNYAGQGYQFARNVSGGDVNIASTTASTSSITGALTIAGGLGLNGSIYCGGSIICSGDANRLGRTGIGMAADANIPVSIFKSGTTAQLKLANYEGATTMSDRNAFFEVLNTVTGGMKITCTGGSGAGALNTITLGAAAAGVVIPCTRVAATYDNAALIVAGGIACSDNCWVRGAADSAQFTVEHYSGGKMMRFFVDTAGNSRIWTSNNTGVISLGLDISGTVSNRISIPYALASTSTSTGALTVVGGLGVGGAVWIGGLLNVAGVLTGGEQTATLNTSWYYYTSGSVAIRCVRLGRVVSIMFPDFSATLNGSAGSYNHVGTSDALAAAYRPAEKTGVGSYYTLAGTAYQGFVEVDTSGVIKFYCLPGRTALINSETLALKNTCITYVVA